MKKNAPTILAVVACLLLVIAMLQLNSLRREVSQLQSRMKSEMEDVFEAVSGLRNELETQLERQNSLLSRSEWAYGEIDEENRTAEVVCTIVPKEYTPGVTSATLVVDGRELPMTYADGAFTATAALPLFQESWIGRVLLNDGETVRAESLDWHIAPRFEMLPMSYAGATGSAKGTPGESAYTWAVDYNVHISIEGKKPYRVETVEIVEVLDGTEIGRIPVDISETTQKAYAEAAAEAGEMISENAGTSATHSDAGGLEVETGYVGFIHPLNKEYAIPNGSELALFVDVVDGSGLRYRSFAEGIAIGADGDPDEDRIGEMMMFDFAEPLWIYDENGDVIYTIAEEYFR